MIVKQTAIKLRWENIIVLLTFSVHLELIAELKANSLIQSDNKLFYGN